MGRIERILHAFIVGLTLLLVSWRASTPAIVRIGVDGLDPLAGLEMTMALGLAAAVLLFVLRAGLGQAFAQAWLRQPPLVILCLLGLLSAAWSISPWVSLLKGVLLGLATLVGAYLGFRFRARGVAAGAAIVTAVVVGLSALTAVLLPFLGRMFSPPYAGAWRGVFWHKNHLGTVLALLGVFAFFRLVDGLRHRRRVVVADGLLVAAVVALVVLSRSATGLIVFAAAVALTATAIVWQRVRDAVRREHLLAGVVVAIAAVALATTQFSRILGLLGKDATLTGRIPMWLVVLRDHASQRPILGYGIGAFWNLEAHTLSVQQAVGWGYPVAIGDNGWLDVLLGLGLLGLVVFVVVLVGMLWRGFQAARVGRDLFDALPLVFTVAALLANAAFSLFFETESGIWLLLVAMSFAALERPSPGAGARADQTQVTSRPA